MISPGSPLCLASLVRESAVSLFVLPPSIPSLVSLLFLTFVLWSKHPRGPVVTRHGNPDDAAEEKHIKSKLWHVFTRTGDDTQIPRRSRARRHNTNCTRKEQTFTHTPKVLRTVRSPRARQFSGPQVLQQGSWLAEYYVGAKKTFYSVEFSPAFTGVSFADAVVHIFEYFEVWFGFSDGFSRTVCVYLDAR